MEANKVIVEIQERALTYPRAQLQAWISGDKSLVPAFVAVPPIVRNQPRYHFAEMLVLRHYHEVEGWLGHASYALGPQYPGSLRRADGRRAVEDIIPGSRLERLRALRSDPSIARDGRGEPDLFLYRTDGSFKFVEVKKGGDRLRQAQFTCIAQILAVLQCEVHEEGTKCRPRTYCFDLEGFTGEKRPKWRADHGQ